MDDNDIFLSSDAMTRHCLGISATGGGKSNFLNLILKQQMMRGGGVIHIDGKSNQGAMSEFLELAKQHNRWQDVRIININDASLSNTYNPLLRGDSDELLSRIMLLIGTGGDSFFRSQAGKGLGAICGLIRRMEIPLNFADLLVLMGSEGALRYLLREGPKDSREYTDYKMFFDQLLESDRRTGAMIVSEKKLQHTFGDLLGKIATYTRGQARDVLNSYSPEVDLLQAMKENLLVYVSLPTVSKSEASRDFAKILLSDMRTAVGFLQSELADRRPNPTFICLMDEFSSYAIPDMDTLFEQARSANICLFPFVQTISSLADKSKGLSPEFSQKIIGNTWNKICFVLQDPESAEYMSKIAGETPKELTSTSIGENIGFASGDQDASMVRTSNRGRSVSTSIRTEYGAVARPEDFMNLMPGEGIYMGSDMTQRRILRIKVPLVKLDKGDGKLDFPRFRMPPVPGLAIAEKYHMFSATGG